MSNVKVRVRIRIDAREHVAPIATIPVLQAFFVVRLHVLTQIDRKSVV